jgi:chromosome segregation ATPase
MSTRPTDRSPLVDAVVALDEELRRYEKLTAEVGRTKITSEKTLARAARAVAEAAASHERFQECVGALSRAMNDARERQEASLVGMAEAARHIGERATAFQSLIARYASLGEVAKSLNVRAAEIMTRRSEGAAPVDVYAAVGALLEGLGEALTEAKALAAVARESDFDGIARDADALEQQLLSARNRLTLAQRAVAERAPS